MHPIGCGLADITQQRCWDGWLYVAVVIDAFSRRIVGWSMAEHLRTELVLEVFYNRRRRHSTLGYLSPADYEANACPPGAVGLADPSTKRG